MLIVNADDFGESRPVNRAILAAFRQGVISSASLMANGAAFAEACDMARQEGLTERIGIHLNITEGPSLTEPIRRCAKFCGPSGNFHFRRNRHFWLTAEERAVLRGEWAAQIERCRAEGLTLSHADSHHHVHTEFPLFGVAASLLREEDIPFLRLSDNVRPAGLARRVYKWLFNRALRHAGLQGSDYFCDAAGLAALPAGALGEDKVIEVMLHPLLDKDGQLIDSGSRQNLTEWRAHIPAGQRLGSYAERRR